MASTHHTKPVRAETYRQAFEQFYEGGLFDWKERWVGGPFLALYQDAVYQIESPHDMAERALLMLTSTDEAVHMPLAIWTSLMERTNHELDCYDYLLHRLTTPAEHHYLQLAHTISRITNRPTEGFWYTLYHLDKSRLYAKAIVATAQYYDSDTFGQELEAALVRHGKTCLNQVSDGIFQTISLMDERAETTSLFYIFTVDPTIWEVSVLV